MTQFQIIVSVSIISTFLISTTYVSFKLKKTLQQDDAIKINNANISHLLEVTKRYIMRKMQEAVLQLTVYITFVIVYTTVLKLEQPSLTIIRFTGAILITVFIGKIIAIYATSAKLEKIKNFSSPDEKVTALNKIINKKHLKNKISD